MERLTLVLGAGASYPSPSDLPLFWPMRDALLRSFDIEPYEVDETILSGLAPERLFSILSEDSDDERHLYTWLADVLGGHEYNTNHWIAAQCLGAGAEVWTTNFDTLIEKAFDALVVDVHVVSWPEEPTDCRCPRGHLFKVHGTVGSRLIFSSEHVLQGLSDAWSARLSKAITKRDVLVAGYQGADLDIAPIMQKYLPDARRTRWMELPGRSTERLLRRFPFLSSGGVIEGDPSVALHGWYSMAAKRERLPPPPPPAVGHREQDLPRFDSSFLSGARLAAQLLGRRTARILFLRAVVRDRSLRRRIGAVSRLAESVLYDPGYLAPAIDLATLLDTRVLRRRRVTSARSRLVFLEGRSRRTKILDEGTWFLEQHSDDIEIKLRVASAAKFNGGIARAIRLSREARDQILAGETHRPSLLGWASFTLGFSLRWAGDYLESQRLNDSLVNDFAAHGGPVWLAWGLYESGALAVLQGRADQGVELIAQATEMLEALGNVTGSLDSELGEIAARRAQGELGGSILQRLDQIESHFRSMRVYSPIRAAMLDFERAESCFSIGDLNSAARWSRAVQRTSPAPEIAVMGMLTEARVAARTDKEQAQRLATTARDAARSANFPYGRVLATLMQSRLNGLGGITVLSRLTGVPDELVASLVRQCKNGWDVTTDVLVFP